MQIFEATTGIFIFIPDLTDDLRDHQFILLLSVLAQQGNLIDISTTYNWILLSNMGDALKLRDTIQKRAIGLIDKSELTDNFPSLSHLGA